MAEHEKSEIGMRKPRLVDPDDLLVEKHPEQELLEARCKICHKMVPTHALNDGVCTHCGMSR
jgi:hypothetical protein